MKASSWKFVYRSISKRSTPLVSNTLRGWRKDLPYRIGSTSSRTSVLKFTKAAQSNSRKSCLIPAMFMGLTVCCRRQSDYSNHIGQEHPFPLELLLGTKGSKKSAEDEDDDDRVPSDEQTVRTSHCSLSFEFLTTVFILYSLLQVQIGRAHV